MSTYDHVTLEDHLTQDTIATTKSADTLINKADGNVTPISTAVALSGYTALTSDYLIRVIGAGTTTITLPTSASFAASGGCETLLVYSSGLTATLTFGGSAIQGFSAGTQGTTGPHLTMLQCDGVNWFMVANW